MFWFVVAFSALIGLNGLVYIFYPLWRADLERRIYDVPPNALRAYGLIFIALSTLLLYYILIVK